VNALENLMAAMEARRIAHNVRRSRLPGWRLYFKAEMGRAIRKWRQYADAVRTP
jgi:hypothetical protein